MASRQTQTYLAEHWKAAPPRVWAYAGLLLLVLGLAAGSLVLILR
jgi:hypothetical protein